MFHAGQKSKKAVLVIILFQFMTSPAWLAAILFYKTFKRGDL